MFIFTYKFPGNFIIFIELLAHVYFYIKVPGKFYYLLQYIELLLEFMRSFVTEKVKNEIT